MEPSLTIIVPVRNAAVGLARRVESILESAADVASHFEVLVVDDASDDQTDEVVQELAHRYPQVRLARHADRQGVDAAIRTGLLRGRGNLVFIHGSEHAPNRQELQELWRLGGKKHLVVGASNTPPLYLKPDLISRLQIWGMMVAQQAGQPDDRRANRKTATGAREPLAPTFAPNHGPSEADARAQSQPSA